MEKEIFGRVLIVLLCLVLSGVVLTIFGGVISILIAPFFEKRMYEKETGKRVSYWDAYFTVLGAYDQKEEDKDCGQENP